MTYNRGALLKRLDKIENTVRPPGSISYNIKNLSPQDRAEYEAHIALSTEWVKARPGEKAYIDLLEQSQDDPYPELARHIADKIFPVYEHSLSAEENYMKCLK